MLTPTPRYGGIFERGSREYTLDDFYSLALDKLDRFVCLKPCDVQFAENDDSSEDDDDDDDEDDGDDEDEDEGGDENENENENESDEETNKSPNKSKKASTPMNEKPEVPEEPERVEKEDPEVVSLIAPRL